MTPNQSVLTVIIVFSLIAVGWLIRLYLQYRRMDQAMQTFMARQIMSTALMYGEVKQVKFYDFGWQPAKGRWDKNVTPSNFPLFPLELGHSYHDCHITLRSGEVVLESFPTAVDIHDAMALAEKYLCEQMRKFSVLASQFNVGVVMPHTRAELESKYPYKELFPNAEE